MGHNEVFMQKQRWKEIRRIYNFLISGIPKTNTVLKVFALDILVQRIYQKSGIRYIRKKENAGDV